MKKGYSFSVVLWAAFGAGGMVSAMITPLLILLTGFLIPMGKIKGDVLSYDWVDRVVSHWFSSIVLLIVVVTPLWMSAFRLYHSLHDLKIQTNLVYKLVIFGGALFLSILPLIAVIAA